MTPKENRILAYVGLLIALIGALAACLAVNSGKSKTNSDSLIYSLSEPERRWDDKEDRQDGFLHIPIQEKNVRIRCSYRVLENEGNFGIAVDMRVRDDEDHKGYRVLVYNNETWEDGYFSGYNEWIAESRPLPEPEESKIKLNEENEIQIQVINDECKIWHNQIYLGTVAVEPMEKPGRFSLLAEGSGGRVEMEFSKLEVYQIN